VNNVEKHYKTNQCEYFNTTCFKDSKPGDDLTKCNGTQICSHTESAEKNEQSFCYTVWSNVTDGRESPHRSGVLVHIQGCIPDVNTHNCRDKTDCVSTDERGKDQTHLFCCCEGNDCNSQFRWDPVETDPTDSLGPVTAPPPSPAASPTIFMLMYVMVPVMVLTVIGLAGCYIYRQRKNPQFNALSTLGDDLQTSPPTPSLTRSNIQLLEIKARGRFGAVWKGQHMNDMVAVKIFPLQDKQSWYAEQEIYSLPQMTHDNILKFIGIEKRGENLQLEFWLVTAFHERGSLCDYLKSNTLNWDDFCRISYTMACGLAHLHEEIPSMKGSGTKPAIAHRDFKSKNVLIKSDMTACIGDFGLALQFRPNEIVGDTHGQVGTRRYMAPEVLEGAINFSRDAFLRIDMYACGLVLWEIASRCTTAYNPPDYRLPFEAEASPHPSLEEISDLVVNQKVRPEIKESWRMHPGLSVLCDTIEESWDHDAEARLSASCVLERLYHMRSINLTQEMRNNTLNVTNPLLTPQVTQVIRLPFKETSTEVTYEESSSA